MILDKQNQKKRTIIGLLITIFLILILSLFIKDLLKNINISFITNFIITRFYFWLSLLLIYLYSTKVEKQRLLIWKEKKYSLEFYIKKIISFFIILFAILFFVAFVIIQNNLKININTQRSEEVFQILRNKNYLILFTSLTAAITEELIMRGYFMARLQMFFKDEKLPIVLSAIFFGIAHIGYESLTKIIVVFIIGLMLGWYYFKYRNIKMLIIIHFLWDYIIILIKTQ